MNWFFGPEGERFIMFSAQHWAALLGVLLMIGLVIGFRKKLRISPWNEAFRLVLSVLMLLLFIALQIWYVRSDQWDVTQSLPLQLSTVAMLLSAVLLMIRNYYLFEFIYFAGIGSALQALFTPVLDVAFPHFWYFYFFVGHGSIIVTAIYFVAVEQYRPVLRSVGRTMLWLNALLLIILPINLITGANYMFVARKPETVSLLDWLGPWPWYLIPLEIVALVMCLILYVPFVVYDWIIKKRD